MEQNQMEVAREILRQLGENKFKAMTGANTFTGSDYSLSFRFKMCRKANLCRITLNALDLYDIEFFKNSPGQGKCLLVETFSGIYNDGLVETFETFTGLNTSL